MRLPTQISRDEIPPAAAMRLRLPPEPGFARREARSELQERPEEEGGDTGETWFPPYENGKAEKEGFEPSRQGFPHLTP